MIRLIKKHSFAAAHRLYDYNGQCERLHGHNYGLEIVLTADELDYQGMIMDFTEVKKELLKALDELWDHRTLLFDKDPLCSSLMSILHDASVCPVSFNPTAENMARFLGEDFFPKILGEKGKRVRIERVSLYETENNCATWEKDYGNAGS